MSERAGIVCDEAAGTLIVRVTGEIDHHTAAHIRAAIDRELFERRPKRLTLDLSRVSFMDSSGLGLIMGRLAVVRELGGEMTVCDPGPETRQILALAGMERLIRIEYTHGLPPPPGTGRRAPDLSDKSDKPDRPGGPAGKTGSRRRCKPSA